MERIIAVKKDEIQKHGSFYIVAQDLSKMLGFPILGLDKTTYCHLAKERPEIAINIGTLSTPALLARLLTLTLVTRLTIAYAALEGVPKNLRPISALTNLAIRARKLRIVVPSNYAKKELEGIGIEVDKVVPHGIDLKKVAQVCNSKSRLTISRDRINVLSVFSNLFQERKILGLHILLYTWSCLPRETRNRARLLLKLPKGKKDFVNQMANSLGVGKEEYLVIDQWLSENEMLCLFNSANIYVHGTLADAFGIPLIESIACGTPVIALDAQPWNEIINEEVGWLVKVSKEIFVQRPGPLTPMHRLRIPDINDFLSKMVAAIQSCDDNDYEKLRNRCKEHARAYSIEMTYSMFNELISHVSTSNSEKA